MIRRILKEDTEPAEGYACSKDKANCGNSPVITAVRTDWDISPMPDKNAVFSLQRHFTEEQLNILRRGHIPQEMEDKWFWFMEGDTLYAHRSWTGICIYRMDIGAGDVHKVTVNRDMDQYSCTSLEEDADRFNRLLDAWTEDEYDYYREWIEETVEMINRAQN